jgi:hypothetical protein
VAGPGLSGRLPGDWDRSAAAVVGDYLTRLAAGLAGSHRARAAILAELTDGLIEAVDAHVRGGMDCGSAARAAVAEFGDPRELARLMVTEQAGATAHRVGLGLVLTGPVVGGVWLVAWMSRSGLGLADQIGVVLSRFPVFVVVLGLGVPAAVLAATAGAGPLMRRLALAPRRTVGLAMLAAGAAVVGDSTLLTGVAIARGPTGGWSWPLAVAVAVSLTRLTAAGTAAHRCARLRAAS